MLRPLFSAIIVSLYTVPASAQDDWTLLTTGYSNTIWDVHFVDDAKGFACGLSGTILSTLDGGDTWSVSTPGGSALREIAFASDQVGIIGGAAGSTARTTDGGSTWTYGNVGTPIQVKEIQFVSPTVGYMAGVADNLFKTTDAGLTWTALPAVLNNVDGMHFLSENEGYVTNGEPGELLHTTDGGASYSTATVDAGTLSYMGTVMFPGNTAIGYAANNNTVYRTLDGGSSWTGVATTVIQPTDIYFLNADVGMVVGNFGQLAYTTDGSNFTSVDFPDISEFRGCWISPGGTAFACGSDGMIYRKGLGLTTAVASPLNGASQFSALPINGLLDIVVSDELVGSTFTIHDVTGHVIDSGRLSSSRTQRGLPSTAGLYIVAVRNNSGNHVQRFVVP